MATLQAARNSGDVMNFFRKKKLAPLDAYNLWADSYSGESNPIKNFSDELIGKWMTEVNGKSVLDAGCGTGKICNLASDRGASRIFGVDLSPAMIKEATKNCLNADFKCLDLSKEKIDGQFDLIVSALVLGHIRNLDFVLTNLLGNLTPNGILLITDFHPFLTLQGARRTFSEKKSGKTFEVEHHLHLFEEYVSCLTKSNACVEEVAEPRWQEQPVVFGMKIRKRDLGPAA